MRILGVTVEYGPGSSGGPILNEHGAVVGLACQAVPLSQQEQEKGTQMIWRFSRPSCSILEMLSKPAADSKPETTSDAKPGSRPAEGG